MVSGHQGPSSQSCVCHLAKFQVSQNGITLRFEQPFPIRQILGSSKLTELAGSNFKFDENGRRFTKWVENNVGKGEIAREEQFLFFPHCFQRTSTADT